MPAYVEDWGQLHEAIPDKENLQWNWQNGRGKGSAES